MKKMGWVLGCMLLACLSFGISFGETAQKTPQKDLQTKLSDYHTLSAVFRQVVYNADGSVLQKSSGEMAVERPSKFQWYIQKPMRQMIETDGQKLWIFDPDLSQVTIRKLDQSAGKMPVLLLTHPDNYFTQLFNITEIKQGFELVPKDKSEMFSNIKLYFNGEKLSRMVLENQLGQKTVIRFYAVSINPEIEIVPPKTFSEDTDVIDLTKADSTQKPQANTKG